MFIAGKRIDLQKLRLIRVIHVTNVCSFWHLVPCQMPQGSSAWQAELWSIFIPIWGALLMCSCANWFPLLLMSLSVPPSHLVAKLPLSRWEMGLSGTLFLSYLVPNLPNSFQSWHVPCSYSN